MNLPALTQTRQTPSPLGPMLLAVSPQGLCGVWFLDQKHFPPVTALQATQLTSTAAARSTDTASDAHAWLDQAAQQLADYFAGQRQHFDLPLDLSAGSAFQQSVWHALLDIGRGQTQSYGALAARVGRPSAARAVGDGRVQPHQHHRALPPRGGQQRLSHRLRGRIRSQGGAVAVGGVLVVSTRA